MYGNLEEFFPITTMTSRVYEIIGML
jgi:hypothetical protein